MTDQFDPQDEEIIARLRKLKSAEKDYPAGALKRRRTAFHRQTSGMLMAGSLVGFLKGRARILSQIPVYGAEIILVGTLVAATGLGVYYFRDEIKDWMNPMTATPVTSVSTLTPQPSLTTSPTPSLTPTPTATLFLASPTDKDNPTDQGWHYGQTRTPKP